MTYRELIYLYKTGKLDEEQKEKVAKDIERQEAIGEYLFDEGEIPGFDTLENMDSIRIFRDDETDKNAGADEILDEEKQFAKMIKASIRKAFIKMGVTVSGIVIVVVLFIIFALPKVVASFYYNPSEVAGRKTFNYSVGDANEDGDAAGTVAERKTLSVVAETDRLSLDMAVYSELFLPGHYSDFVLSDARGYGVYDIEIHSGMNKVAGKIDKNKLILYDLSVLNRPVVNCVYPQKANVFYSYILEDIEEQSKNMLDSLQKLEDDKQYGVFVTFSDVYNYSELKQWSKENDLVFPQWCAICKKDEFDVENYSADELIGFINGGSGASMFYDKQMYPILTQYDLSKTTSEEKDWEISEEDMTTHVISTLQYMKDQETFNEMIGLKQGMFFDTYQKLIDSIKNNGLIIYGFYGEGTKEEILELSKLDEVAYIYTVPVE